MSVEPPPFPGSEAPAPVPVVPVYYATPSLRGRPGVLTAVGVISCIVGGLSLLASGFWGLTTLGFLLMSLSPGPAVTVAPAAPTSGGVVSPNSMLVTSDDALDARTATSVVNAMMARRSLSEERQVQLQALMVQAGQKIFPGDASARSPSVIRNNITQSSTIPGFGSNGGSTHFTVGTGRIEVYDDHAVFRPDGSAQTVSVSVSGDQTSQNVAAAMVMPTTTPTGFKVSARATASSSFTPVALPRVAVPIAVTGMAENALSLCVAVLLLMAGIMTLRDSRKAATVHWIYVFAKIPLAILAAVMGWMMFRDLLFSSPRAATAPPGARGMLTAFAVMGGVIALVYPVALVFVLRSRRVREYYGGVRE